jgi:formamidopyrimidine-DNA glycosylase
MPELPEVETTRCGIEPHIKEQKIDKIIVRHFKLRWPIPSNIQTYLQNQTVKLGAVYISHRQPHYSTC